MYYACVCAIAKDETPHLREWALHHFAVGFEHIVLYDNGSAVPAALTLADLADAGLLTVIDFPRREAPQLSAYYAVAGWPSLILTNSYCPWPAVTCGICWKAMKPGPVWRRTGWSSAPAAICADRRRG